ncbi:MAG: hypothetical protein WCD42_07850 [Rhizomicrobium sp.]
MSDVKIGNLNIGGIDDGRNLDVSLVVVGHDEAGVGSFSGQLEKKTFAVTLQGKNYVTGVGPAKHSFALSGTAFPDVFGGSNIPTLNIVLDGPFGTTGTADYTIWHDTPDLIVVRGAKVHATWK